MRAFSKPVAVGRAVYIGALALILFIVLTAAVQVRLLAGLDLGFMEGLRGPDVSWLMLWATFTGVAVAGPVSVVWVLVVAFLLRRKGSARWWLPPLALLLVTLVEVALKSTVNQPGEDLHQFVRRTYYPFAAVELSGTFPSGHLARMAFLLTYLGSWLRSRRGLVGHIAVPACLVVAVAVGFSRLYVADHWPSDVVAGLLLGAGVALLVVDQSFSIHQGTVASGTQSPRVR
jgi:membrane-associated phospholipid phosphatase